MARKHGNSNTLKKVFFVVFLSEDLRSKILLAGQTTDFHAWHSAEFVTSMAQIVIHYQGFFVRQSWPGGLEMLLAGQIADFHAWRTAEFVTSCAQIVFHDAGYSSARGSGLPAPWETWDAGIE